MDMMMQPFPMYAAGTTGTRKGRLYMVVGWVPHHETAPDLGMVPVLVPVSGGAVAKKYDTDGGIAKLFPTMGSALEFLDLESTRKAS